MGQNNIDFQHQPSSALNDQALDATNDFGGYEPFVDEVVVARFLQFTARRVLEMARDGEIPAHPIGRGPRKTWRFRISEIDAHYSVDRKPAGANLKSAVPGATRRQ